MAAGRRLVVSPAGAGRRLDVFLAAEIAEVSRTQLTRHVAEGAEHVLVQGEIAAAQVQSALITYNQRLS
jgi:hypothetical protein